MIHELKTIVFQALKNQKEGINSVLVSLVYLEGSSYRPPGVRMLMSENGQFYGAISGGCVEKEVYKRAKSVFETGVAKVITYDGRFRLGCEGLLYILIEPFSVSNEFADAFSRHFQKRFPLKIKSFFKLKDEELGNFGTQFYFDSGVSPSYEHLKVNDDLESFTEELAPCFKLLIVGNEHDTKPLCSFASKLGWEVDLIAGINSSVEFDDFEGLNKLIKEIPENLDFTSLDSQTVVVLMTHNYVQDLKYLVQLKDSKVPYIGILGSRKRKSKLENDLFAQVDDLSEDFLEKLHSPAGLNIGAQTPAEIAISIVAEIMQITRKKELPVLW